MNELVKVVLTVAGLSGLTGPLSAQAPQSADPGPMVYQIALQVITRNGAWMRELDNSSASYQQWWRSEDEWLRQLETIDVARIRDTPSAPLFGVLLSELEASRASRVCRGHLWGLDTLFPSGPPHVTELPGIFDLESASLSREAFLVTSLPRVPPFIDAEIANLREGMDGGYVAPRLVVERWIAESDSLLSLSVEESPFLSFARGSLSEPLVLGFLEREVLPSFRRYRDFLRNEYLPVAREVPGLAGLPQGAECWRAEIRRQTTLDLDPATLDSMGRSMLEAASTRWDSIATSVYGLSDGRTLTAALAADPGIQFASWDEAVRAANDILGLVSPVLPQFFQVLPENLAPVFEVGHLRALTLAAYSSEAKVTLNSQAVYPGVNRRNLGPIVLHEVVGHHFQRGLAGDGIQAFNGIRLPAFSEGWATYAEGLVLDADRFRDETLAESLAESRVGRSASIVVLNGIHGAGWTPEMAIDTLRAYVGGPDEDLELRLLGLVERPGNVLSYELGMQTLVDLRSQAEGALGSRFDLREFHRVVLEDGRITLGMLREKVAGWIAAAN